MIKNKSKVLSCLSLLGLGVTIISTIKDTKKISKTNTKDMRKKEKIKTCLKCYAPTIISMTATAACIIGSEKQHSDERLALLTAISSLQGNYKDLRTAVDEAPNETGEEILKNTIKNKVPRDVYIEKTELKTFYEEYNGVYFTTDIDSVLKAEYLFNKQLAITGIGTLNDFYKYLGLKTTNEGDYIGWQSDYLYDDTYSSAKDGFWLDDDVDTFNPWVNFAHKKMISEEGMEYYYIAYLNHPDGLYSPKL